MLPLSFRNHFKVMRNDGMGHRVFLNGRINWIYICICLMATCMINTSYTHLHVWYTCQQNFLYICNEWMESTISYTHDRLQIQLRAPQTQTTHKYTCFSIYIDYTCKAISFCSIYFNLFAIAVLIGIPEWTVGTNWKKVKEEWR